MRTLLDRPAPHAAPRAWLDDLTPQDRTLFWRYGAGPPAVVPYTAVHHAFEHQAARDPHAVAVEHAGTSITYGELDRRADLLAAHLAAFGVRPGDCVALCVRRSIEMIIGILATLKAGAAYAPQDVVVAPEPQLRHVITTTRAKVVLTQSAVAHLVPAVSGVNVVAVDEIDWAPSVARHRVRLQPARRAAGDDGCYVLFTSGTTGRPNGVTVTHANVANIILTAPGDLGIQPGWRVAQILCIAFDMAAWEILGCLTHGAALVIRGADIEAAVRDVDVVIATPTVLGTIDPDVCRSVRVVAVAGEPCPRPLADRWAERCTFFNACGPTETTIVNTMQRHVPDAARLTIGRPTPNNTVYILDERGRPCPIGEVGEMWAGGACVSAGYLDDPTLTAERYAPDPFLGGGRLMFRTRDLGRWTSDGELEHLGRTDDQVKVRGGFRVELDSVSAVLESAGCRQAVTIKVDNSLVSFVTPDDVDAASVRTAVAAALPYYCVPEAVHPLAALPLTSRGKVDKARLGQLAVELRDATAVAS